VQGACDAIGTGSRSVEDRYAGDAQTVTFQIRVNRIEAIQRKRLDFGSDASGLSD
jgi:hypothetical protein